jgi:hypothetical protein
MRREQQPALAWPTGAGRSGALLCAALLTLAGLYAAVAADAPDDAMDFPRNVLTWYLSGDAEQLWPHAGPVLRELAEDLEGLREAAEDIEEMMGPQTALLDEQIFDHPEGGGWRVYVGTLRHARAGEMFWVVIFSPAQREVQMIMPQTRHTIQTFFPQTRLP